MPGQRMLGQRMLGQRMPGQRMPAGTRPTGKAAKTGCTTTLRLNDKIHAACWHAGFSVIEASDLTNLKSLAAHNYPPPVRDPAHTILPVPRRIHGRELGLVIDEDARACSWTTPCLQCGCSTWATWRTFIPFPASTPVRTSLPEPVPEDASAPINSRNTWTEPWFSPPGSAGGRGSWTSPTPLLPQEVRSYIPNPGTGQAVPRSNDVDGRGLIYLLNRLDDLDILAMEG